ncbi:MAG TPA: MoaD/ThiS family protein [Gemmatimonadota bacterium]|jgi:molybdopterin converting factor small subunit|nr:MoaD/ThiS family protein [Gemmatimonadota bacterium]
MRAATFQVLLFGPAREAAGSDRAAVEVPVPATAAEVLAALSRAHPGLGDLMPRSRVAVNRRYVDLATRVAPGDEIAVIPPVGGG